MNIACCSNNLETYDTINCYSDNTLEDNECTLIIHNSMIHVTKKTVFRSF